MTDEAENEKKPEVGYVIHFTKQTGSLGEMVQITTQLPKGATEEEISTELVKFGRALDARMRDLNREVVKRTGKNLEQMGLVPEGTIGEAEMAEALMKKVAAKGNA